MPAPCVAEASRSPHNPTRSDGRSATRRYGQSVQGFPDTGRAWRRRAGRLGLALAIVLGLVAGSIAGATLALRAFGETTGHLALGTVTISVQPTTSGRAEVFLPLLDWEVAARPFRAPVVVRAEVSTVNRDQALAALRSGRDATAQVERARSEVPPLVRDAVTHAIVVA